MKLSDLKTGWRVELRDGNTYVVLRDCETSVYGHQDIMFINLNTINFGGYTVGSDYDSKLLNKEYSDYDIMKVYAMYVDSVAFNKDYMGDLVWERSLEPKDMTLKDIEDKLGYPVRIVGE